MSQLMMMMHVTVGVVTSLSLTSERRECTLRDHIADIRTGKVMTDIGGLETFEINFDACSASLRGCD